MLDIPIGSHLVCIGANISHHGIYVGKNQVVHYVGWDSSKLSKRPIDKTSIQKFHEGNNCFILSHQSPKYQGDEVVKRAISMMGENSYNLVLNNCEHFALWCIFGEKASRQIRSAQIGTALASGSTAGAATGLQIGFTAVVSSTIGALPGGAFSVPAVAWLGSIIGPYTAYVVVGSFFVAGSIAIPAAVFAGVGWQTFSIGRKLYQKSRLTKIG